MGGLLIKFDWGHQLPLGKQGVDLADELKGSVLLVQDQGVHGGDDDRNLPSIKENLELVPVVPLTGVILSIAKTVHGDVGWEVAREDLRD